MFIIFVVILGLNVIDLNILRSTCEKILSEQPEKLKTSYELTLSFEPEADFHERRLRLGRFYGKKGEHLKVLQHKYNVHIHLKIHFPSRPTSRKRKVTNPNAVQVLITRQDKTITERIPIEKLTEEINEKWEESSEVRFIQKQFTFSQNQWQFVSLSFESNLSVDERRDAIGRFIGKKGEYLRPFEDQHNIRLYIVDSQTKNRKYCLKLIEIQEDNPNIVYLFITKKDKSIADEIPIEQVKEQIIEKWKQATMEPVDNELFHIASFPYESKVSWRQRQKKIGHFIGKKGQHLRRLQQKYNINIQIMNHLSKRKLQRKLAKIQDEDKTNKLYLIITNKNKSSTDIIPIEKITQSLTNLWHYGKQSGCNNKKQSSSLYPEPIEFSCDDRWQPKKNRRRK